MTHMTSKIVNAISKTIIDGAKQTEIWSLGVRGYLVYNNYFIICIFQWIHSVAFIMRKLVIHGIVFQPTVDMLWVIVLDSYPVTGTRMS